MKNIFTENKPGNINIIAFLLIIVFLIVPNLVFSQVNEHIKHKPPSPTKHHEVKDDDYIPVSRADQGRSPAYHYSMSNITTVQVNVDANGQNIVGDAANEPSIAIDPNDHNKMVIGWRQFNTVTNNFRQNGYGYTTDGGMTWTFPGVIQPGIFRSDPVLDYDEAGNFYYNSLTDDPDYYCKVFKSTNGGSTWNSGTDAHGGDKQWMTIDKTSGIGNGNIYAFWTSFYSTCYPGFFTRSTDEGVSFENCITIPNEPYWGTLTVASNGDLYVGGTDGYSYDFIVAKSTNAQIPGQTITWNMFTTVSLDGPITYGISPNPGGLGGQTSIAVDTSGGPYNGNVYLLCSVQRNSNPDPLDVMFARSTNGGVNWSSPVRVNDDVSTTAYQWFGTMSVAPNGRIDVIWLDTRDHPGTNISALYYSNSMDGGVTWSLNERLSDYFDPHIGWPNQNKMGDYFHMVSDINGARLAWAATFNGEQDVYYSYINVTTTFQLSVSVTNGWNMVSVPGIDPDGQGVTTWWSGLTGTVYKFVPGTGYSAVTTTTPTEGYWMKQVGDNVYNTGDEWPAGGIQIVPHDPISAAVGWNLIGGYENTVDVAALTTTPPGQILYPIYKYVPGTGYETAATIDPGYGYWIKVSSSCQINIPGALTKVSGKTAENIMDNLSAGTVNPGRIIVTDAAGNSCTLYAVNGNLNLTRYELPPLPPSGVFDIRYSSGRRAENIGSDFKTIMMNGVIYPVKIKAENMDIRLQDITGKEVNVNVKKGEEITISNPNIVMLKVSGQLAPGNYALEQNYPNPFNPATGIKYVVGSKQFVTLKVYDVLGNEIAALVNEEKPAGSYSIVFDGSKFSSGVYFYQIRAGNFVQTKKMILLR
jgi:hypothetical protein